MSQGKRSRPGPPDAAPASKTPQEPRPLGSRVMVPSGNYEYYGLRPPAPGVVQARPFLGQPGWTPPAWLLEYHGFSPAKPAEGAAPPAVQQKEAALHTKPQSMALEALHSDPGSGLPHRERIQAAFGDHCAEVRPEGGEFR